MDERDICCRELSGAGVEGGSRPASAPDRLGFSKIPVRDAPRGTVPTHLTTLSNLRSTRQSKLLSLFRSAVATMVRSRAPASVKGSPFRLLADAVSNPYIAIVGIFGELGSAYLRETGRRRKNNSNEKSGCLVTDMRPNVGPISLSRPIHSCTLLC